jgi:hypothetical protein
MRQLVRFGTARQVYRPGELIVPNRPKYPPAPPDDEEPNPEPGVVHWSPPYPWAAFAAHAAINAWVDVRDLAVPPDWFDRTLAAKKAWLAETYGDG